MFKDYSISSNLANRYNAAAWKTSINGNTILILREVKVAGGKGQPDKGDMILVELDANGHLVQEFVIWTPNEKEYLLEDPRALVLNNDQVLIGLTAVDQTVMKPYPAITVLKSTAWQERLPEVKVIKEFGYGKNVTPINSSTFLFRGEGAENNHRLIVFGFDGNNVQQLGHIQFPKDLAWAKWRIGTTMPPIWINDHEALMIIHGITIIDGKFIYSLGRAKLHKHEGQNYQIEVDPMPVLTPDHFLSPDGTPLVEELHPELRRVVYACGGIMKQSQSEEEILSLFVNIGDRQTIEVPFSFSSLKIGWWN